MFRKFLLSALIGAVCVAFTVILSGATQSKAAGALVDLPSFVIVIIAPFLIVTASFGLRATSRAFGAPFDEAATVRELKTAKAWFASLMRYIAAFAVFAFSIAFVMIMVYAAGQDSSIVGKNFAVAILGVFYASILPIFLILPFRQAIDARLAERE